MKKRTGIKPINYFFTVCLVFVKMLTVSGQVSDDFSDGDFSNSPTWSGTTADFVVNGSNQLQSNGDQAAADTLYLTTPNTLLDSVEWQFYMHLDFNPTASTNYVKIYLATDQADLTGSLNGYYLRIGETGSSDTLELWRQDGVADTKILTGNVSYGSTFDANIKVTRDQLGNWTLYSDPTAGTSFVNEGSVLDNTHTTTQQFGVYCKYSTTSRFDMYYFDNITIGTIVGDTIRPTIQSVTVISDSTLDVLYSEDIDQTTAENLTNYSVNNSIGAPSVATIDGSNSALIHLEFATHFTNGETYTLTTQNVEDLSGNSLLTSNDDFLYFNAVAANYRDIVINEIFADPSPQIGLPAQEYIELYNASADIFDLSGWTFADPSTTATLGSYLLLPDSYVIIADDDFTFDFSMYSNVLFVSTLPSLNNASDEISLSDDGSNLIDFVGYSDSWYQDADKDGGGYSLEQINPLSPCTNSTNWIASNHTFGGTPGQVNSVYDNSPDVIAPSITTAYLISGISANICFSETLDTAGNLNSQITCSGGITVSNATLDPNLSCVTLTFGTALDTGVVYTITVNGPSDCSGNVINQSVEVVLPHTPVAGDLIINEVLSNPFNGGDDFVEVYNRSDKYIDLLNWHLANWDDGIIDNYKTITTNFLLSPGKYCVLTKDSADIQLNYFESVPGRFLQMSSLPTYSNDSGTVYLILPDTDSTVSDGFSYTEDMHFGLINDPDGVSLERIDFNRNTNDPTNWHSAAESAGWATPGKENSQYYPGQITSDMVNVEPEIFSPDNDGIDDILTINYSMDEPGIVANVTIFDSQGRIVRHLAQNELLAAEGTISWDGLNNQREKARIGMYIIYFETFDLEGNVSGIKESCVLASKF